MTDPKDSPGQGDVHQLIVADLRHLPVIRATSRDSASTICTTDLPRPSERRGHRTTDHIAPYITAALSQHPVSLSRVCLIL